MTSTRVMTRAQLHPTIRTPADDCPPYDPSIWEGVDTLYLTRRAELDLQRRRLQNSKDAVEFLAGRPGEDDASSSASSQQQKQQQQQPSGSHVLPPSGARALWQKILFKMFPPPPPPPFNPAELSFDDVFSRFQLAIQNGDVGQSTLYAQELARRKANISAAVTSGAAGASPSAGGVGIGVGGGAASGAQRQLWGR